MDYVTTPYQDSDERAVGEFYHFMFRRALSINRRYLRWKYDQNPWIRRRQMALTRSGDEIVAMRGAVGTSWEDRDGNEFTLPHVDDLLIHPEHRGKGLFVPLMNAFEKQLGDAGYKTLISLSGGVPTQQLQLATGWKEVQPLNVLTLNREPGSGSADEDTFRKEVHRYACAANRRLQMLPLATFLKKMQSLVGTGFFIGSNKEFRMINPSSHLRNSILPDPVPFLKMRRSRTRDSYSWQLRHPTRVFKVVWYRDSLCWGYVILSWKSANPAVIHIADFCVSDDALLTHIVETLIKQFPIPFQILSNALTEPQITALLNLGFDGSPNPYSRSQKFCFLIKHVGGTLEEQQALESHLKNATVQYIDKMQG